MQRAVRVGDLATFKAYGRTTTWTVDSVDADVTKIRAGPFEITRKQDRWTINNGWTKLDITWTLRDLPEELTKLRELWLSGELLARDVAIWMRHLYPKRGTHEGELILDIVMRITADNKDYWGYDNPDSPYAQPNEFALYYDLEDDSIAYYPLDDPCVKKFDDVETKIMLYAK